MKRVLVLILGLMMLFFLFIGCSSNKVINNDENKESLSNQKQDSSHISEKTEVSFNLQSFKNALTSRGYNTSIDNKVSKGLLSVKPIIFDYKGNKFIVHEYKNSTDMENEAIRINKDGSYKNTVIEYEASSHFYKKGKIIVMYVGENKELINILKQIMGEEFAGS